MNNSMDIIVKMLTLSIMGGFCGIGGYFLEFCFAEGNVLGSYLPWLAKRVIKRFKPADYKEVMLLPKGDVRDNEFIGRALYLPFYKMFGGCSICFNVHCCTIVFIVLHFTMGFGWWYLPCLTLSAHLVLRKLVGV